MSHLEIAENIYWVGVVDWGLRDFHGYSLARKGTTYNAFLIKDKKVTLIDTVDSRFRDPFLENILRLIDPQEISYLIINHVEPDHSGCLVELVERARPEKIFCSRMGCQFMKEFYHKENWPYHVVKTGEEIELGEKTVQFIEMPMLHWPDNMGCYVKQDQLLISSDAFGHNWATSERFDDQVEKEQLFSNLGHYFANIIMPFSHNVLTVLAKIKEMGWKIDMLAPDHGVIFRKYVSEALGAYKRWASCQTEQKAVIAYDTMWGSTKKMAEAIETGLVEEGISVKVLPLKSSHHSDVMGEVLDARAIIVGSSTHNNGVLPLVADLLRYMQGLRPGGRIGAAFGSYGWSGEAVKDIAKALEDMRIDVIGSVKVKNVPTVDQINQCVELGRQIGLAIKSASSRQDEAYGSLSRAK